ncbi:MAG TPA: hypothetical protein VGO46_16835, partial [Gemmatimonadaceae bacterium]|nr:hypothetical protein [Gemmatimonadaceae bacterium]
HSIGCNTVAHLARMRPELVRRAVFIGPLWTRSKHPRIRIALRLALDAFREPLSLYRYVIPAYWRVGFAHWWQTGMRFAPDVGCERKLPCDSIVVAGVRDPLPDRSCVAVQDVAGAHACVFSHPHDITRVLGSPPALSDPPRS